MSYRKKDVRYDETGSYYITIKTKDNVPYFGKIIEGVMFPTESGKIAEECWLRIPNHYPQIKLGKHVIMPDHVHGILDLDKNLIENRSSNRRLVFGNVLRGSVSEILNQYKGAVTRILRQKGFRFEWHVRFYDRIIRDQDERFRIEQYIETNPANWKKGKLRF